MVFDKKFVRFGMLNITWTASRGQEMSNIQAIHKRSARTEAIVNTAVDPVTAFVCEEHLEAVAIAVRDAERANGDGGELSFLVSTVRDLWSQLKKDGIKHQFGKKDLIIWAILEVVDTEVSFHEIFNWLKHEATISEVICGDDTTSMTSLLKKKSGKGAWERYQRLLRNKL